MRYKFIFTTTIFKITAGKDLSLVLKNAPLYRTASCNIFLKQSVSEHISNCSFSCPDVLSHTDFISEET